MDKTILLVTLLLLLGVTTLFAQGQGTYYAALRIPRDLQDNFGKEMASIKERLPKIHFYKFNDVEELHVTLYFYGELSREKRDLVRQSLREVAMECKAFTLRYEGLDVFNFRNGPPRVLWARCLGATHSLQNLGKRIGDKATRDGFPKPSFSFNPHVTLLRAPNRQAGKAITVSLKLKEKQPVFGEQVVTEFVLLRSGTPFDRAGPTIIERFELEK